MSWSSPGYVTQYYNNVTQQWSPVWSATGVYSISSDVTLNIAMEAGFSVSGVVTDDATTTSPLANVYVSLWNETDGLGFGAITRASGAFSIEGIPASGDAYTLAVQAKGYTTHNDEVSIATENVQLPTIALTKQAGSISGLATSGSLLFVYTNTNQFVTIAVANDGNYAVTGLADGAYRVDLDSNGDLVTDATKPAEISGQSNAVVNF